MSFAPSTIIAAKIMAELRCNKCAHLKQGFCTRLREVVPNSLIKFFLGGASALYSGTVAYPSKCGIEKEVEIGVLMPEVLDYKYGYCQHKKDKSLTFGMNFSYL
jgi:hypothetical protein